MRDALKQSNLIRQSAERFPDESAIQVVGSILLDDSATQRDLAAAVLSFGGSAAVEYLSKMMGDGGDAKPPQMNTRRRERC